MSAFYFIGDADLDKKRWIAHNAFLVATGRLSQWSVMPEIREAVVEHLEKIGIKIP